MSLEQKLILSIVAAIATVAVVAKRAGKDNPTWFVLLAFCLLGGMTASNVQADTAEPHDHGNRPQVFVPVFFGGRPWDPNCGDLPQPLPGEPPCCGPGVDGEWCADPEPGAPEIGSQLDSPLPAPTPWPELYPPNRCSICHQ